MPPNQGAQYGAAPQPGGGKSRKGLFAVLGLLAALVIGGGAFAVFSGGDDDSGQAATTTTSVETPTTETTVTSESTTVPEVLTTDQIATSVVQIFPAVDGIPVCQGSGTIVSADGLIITNAHVVENFGPCAYDSVLIALTSSADEAPTITYEGEVYALDNALDLAVIGVAADLDGNPVTVTDLPALEIGDSDLVGLGDQIRILGYPALGGETITFTSGSVSGFTSEAGIGTRAWIKTDATISGGNSGGLAINDDFEMIGVPTQASGGSDLEIADCRVVTDTNGDGFVDDNDSCIPIGGFINGIRPVNLVTDLLDQAANREVVEQEPAVVEDASRAVFTDLTMTSDVDGNEAIDDVVQLPAGAPKVCGVFDYEEMPDGVSWDALWTHDGEFVEGYSVVESEWVGGRSGIDWWVCATGGEAGLPDGLYELQLYIAGEFSSSNTVHVGGSGPFTLTVVNDLDFEVCFLQISPEIANGWGPDDLDATQTIPIGTSADLVLPGENYDVLAQDCSLDNQVEIYGVELLSDGVVLNLSSG